MKNLIKTILLSAFILSISCINAQNESAVFNNKNYTLIEGHWHLQYGENYKTENILYVKSKDLNEAYIQEIEQSFNLQYMKSFLSDFHVFYLESNLELLKAAKRLAALPAIEKVEIGCYGNYNAAPNDMLYGTSQWNLKYTGNGIAVDSAWTITHGIPSIKVMVIDNGVDYHHPDLGLGVDGYQNIFTNPNEDAWIAPFSTTTNNGSSNGIDDDSNTLIDDWKGWNFYTNWTTGGTKNANYYPGGASPTNNHGTPCAGIIAAKTNNSIGISGIAGGFGTEGVKIVPINTGPYPSNYHTIQSLEYGINLGVDVISMSYGAGSPYNSNMILDGLLQTAYRSGIAIVSSAGNEALSSSPWAPAVQYPANSPYVMGVGAYGFNGFRKNYSNYGQYLDIAAPTDVQSTTTVWGSYGSFGGTSAAAPHVAGVIALMKSANPCMSTDDIYQIIKSTATKSGGYNYNWSNSQKGHSKEFGYGRINAFEAVKKADQVKSNTLDLYIRDDVYDFGVEPNTTSNMFYLSSDIWVRNQNDGLVNQTHQNPLFHPTTPVYVNVRVRNKSCVASTGTEQLHLHWSKAGANLGWPASWDGSTPSPTLGDLISTVTIPVIQAGRDSILTIPWLIPNPNLYTSVGNDKWHFCLLGRIISPNDPLYSPETFDLGRNIKDNNNIAMKNVTVTSSSVISSGGDFFINHGGTISVGGMQEIEGVFSLDFSSDDDNFNEQYEVLLEVDDFLYEKIMNSGPNNNLNQIDYNTFLIQEDPYVINNLEFAENESFTMSLSFRSTEYDPTRKVNYYVNQINEDFQIVGGELFVVTQNIEEPSGNVNDEPAIMYEDIDEEIEMNKTENEESLEEVNLSTIDYQISPNPTAELVEIKSTNEFFPLETIVVFDIFGKELIRVDNIEVLDYKLNLSKYPSGIYFVHINDSKTLKVVKK